MNYLLRAPQFGDSRLGHCWSDMVRLGAGGAGRGKAVSVYSTKNLTSRRLLYIALGELEIGDLT